MNHFLNRYFLRAFYWSFIALCIFQIIGSFVSMHQLQLGYFWDLHVYFDEFQSADLPYLYPPPTKQFFQYLSTLVSIEVLGYFFSSITFISSFAMIYFIKANHSRSVKTIDDDEIIQHDWLYEISLAIAFLAFLSLSIWSCQTGNLHPLFYTIAIAFLLAKTTQVQYLYAFLLGVISVFKPTMLLLAFLNPKKAWLSMITCIALLSLSAFYYPTEFKDFLYQAKLRNIQGDYGASLGLAVIYGGLKNLFFQQNYESLIYHVAIMVHLSVFAVISWVFYLNKKNCSLSWSIWILLIFLANPRIKLYDLPYLSLITSFLIFRILQQLEFFKSIVLGKIDFFLFIVSLGFFGILFLKHDLEWLFGLSFYGTLLFIISQNLALFDLNPLIKRRTR